MSFSLLEVKKKCTTVKDRIIGCHRYINNNSILTPNVKYALNQYVNYRFSKRQNVTFTSKRLQQLVIDLLQYCCDEHIDNITYNHVEANEGSILYEIKRAIYYGATKCLYNAHKEDNTVYTVSDNIVPVYFTTLSKSQLSNRHTVEEYFSELR